MKATARACWRPTSGRRCGVAELHRDVQQQEILTESQHRPEKAEHPKKTHLSRPCSEWIWFARFSASLGVDVICTLFSFRKVVTRAAAAAALLGARLLCTKRWCGHRADRSKQGPKDPFPGSCPNLLGVFDIITSRDDAAGQEGDDVQGEQDGGRVTCRRGAGGLVWVRAFGHLLLGNSRLARDLQAC